MRTSWVSAKEFVVNAADGGLVQGINAGRRFQVLGGDKVTALRHGR